MSESNAGRAPAKVWTIRELLGWCKPWLEERGVDSPRLTAELLLAHVLEVPRIRLYADIDRPLERGELARFKELVQRRARGEPTQYVIGTQDFYGRTFKVDARALIPRPETELVAERVLRHLPKDEPVRVADVGCGTGAIGLTIACERPQAQVVLSDVSPEAAALARENAQALGVEERIEVRVGDLGEALGDEPFDAVVANLPYIPTTDAPSLDVHIRDHEPHLALFGGPDGLDVIRRFVPQLAALVRPGGLAVLEHSEEHGPPIAALFDREAWEEPVTERDLAGLARFTWAVRRG